MNAKNNILSKANKKHLFFTDRCNSSIKHAYELCAKLNPFCKRVLIQKEGGWMTYDKFAKDMGFEVEYVKTNDSIVDLLDLQEKLISEEYLLFIFNRIPGYFCKNDSEEINNICHMYNVLTIEDECAELAATESDFIVCSFGRWKPLNLGHGGFIASDHDLSKIKIECKYPEIESEVLPFLENYEKRTIHLKSIVKKVKKDLKDFEIIHKKYDGLNVIVGFKSDSEKKKIIEYCQKEGFEFEECPRDIRINRPAISIETKRK